MSALLANLEKFAGVGGGLDRTLTAGNAKLALLDCPSGTVRAAGVMSAGIADGTLRLSLANAMS